MCLTSLLFFFFMQEPSIARQLWQAIEAEPGIDIVQAFHQRRPDGVQPQDESSLNNLGYYLINQNMPEKAHVVFQLNTQLFPQSAYAWDSLAGSHRSKQELAQAIALYRKAFALFPDPQIWQRLGETLVEQGDAPVIRNHLRQTRARFPSVAAEDAWLAELARQGALTFPQRSFGELQSRFPDAYLWRSRAQIDAPDRLDGWSVARENAMDLDAVAKRVATNQIPRLNAVVVVKGPQIIAEAYFNGGNRYKQHDVRSVGKSITAILVGVAADMGLLDIHKPLFDYFPGQREEAAWRPEKDGLQLHHLLAMRSGLDADVKDGNTAGNEDRYQQREHDWRDYVLALDLTSKPGEKLVYASANYLLLSEVIGQVYPEGMDVFAKRFLFDPLTISDQTWVRTPRGRAYGAGGNRITARDLAKIGVLVRDGGLWQGQRVVSNAWINTMIEAKGPDILWQKTYGYGWYQSQQVIADQSYEIWQAAGNGGNRVWVIPKLDAVVVVLMSNYNRPEQRLSDELFRDTLLPALSKLN